jgi:glycosyltransferase involved in cell wall biosynthesis
VRVGLVLEQCLAPVPGGTGRYSREVAAALARRAPAGAHLSGATAWHRARLAVPDVPVQRLPLGRRPLVALWERGVGPSVPGDVVHALTPLAPPRRRTPLVVTVHDAVPWTHPETLTPRGVRWHRTAVGRAARTADVIVVPTRAVADELARHVPLGDRVQVIGEGVSGELALPADAATRAARMALPERFLLTVATLEPRKGLSVLLSALAAPAAPDLPLLVVGQPGWGGLDPAAEAARLGLAGRVRLLGRVPDADLAVLLRRATALVVPSRAEGFGLPLLEAMSVGTPVVISPAPALVEVAGGAALVAPDAELAQALRAVVEDDGLRARLAGAGPVRAAAYSWDAAADALWAAYAAISQIRA